MKQRILLWFEALVTVGPLSRNEVAISLQNIEQEALLSTRKRLGSCVYPILRIHTNTVNVAKYSLCCIYNWTQKALHCIRSSKCGSGVLQKPEKKIRSINTVRPMTSWLRGTRWNSVTTERQHKSKYWYWLRTTSWLSSHGVQGWSCVQYAVFPPRQSLLLDKYTLICAEIRLFWR